MLDFAVLDSSQSPSPVIIGFLHRFGKNVGLKSMSNMHVFTSNECIHLYCSQLEKMIKIPILTNVRAGPGIRKISGPGQRPESLGVAGCGSLFLPGVPGRGARVGDPPATLPTLGGGGGESGKRGG